MYQRAVSADNVDYVPAGIPTGISHETVDSTSGNMTTTVEQSNRHRNTQTDNIQNKGAFSEVGELLSKLRLSSMDTGDILLAAILYFTLHDSGDDDLFWIAAILFLTGRNGGDK